MCRFLSFYLGVYVKRFPGAEVEDILNKVLMGGLNHYILGFRLIFIFVGTNNIGNGRSDIILRDMQRLVDVLMSINPNL